MTPRSGSRPATRFNQDANGSVLRSEFMSRVGTGMWKPREPLRIGFMPLSDSAPVIYAKESGLFAQYGLDVELQRECGWANIRDKVINGELDAAQAPVSLPFLANL